MAKDAARSGWTLVDRALKQQVYRTALFGHYRQDARYVTLRDDLLVPLFAAALKYYKARD